MEVASLTETQSYLRQRDVGVNDGRERGGWLDPKDAGNTVLYFFGRDG